MSIIELFSEYEDEVSNVILDSEPEEPELWFEWHGDCISMLETYYYFNKWDYKDSSIGEALYLYTALDGDVISLIVEYYKDHWMNQFEEMFPGRLRRFKKRKIN